MPQPVRRVALAIIEKDGRILIARRRATGSFPHCWELPGGKCGSGEEPEECLVREVLEETGLRVTASAPGFVHVHAYPDKSLEFHVFFCRVLEGEARPMESEQLAWIDWNEIDRFEFPPANRKIFSEARRLAKGRYPAG